MEVQKISDSQTILSKNNAGRSITIPDQVILQSHCNKWKQYQLQNMHADQQNREDRDINPQLLPSNSDKDAKNIHWEKKPKKQKPASSTNDIGKTRYPYVEGKWTSMFQLLTKINSS